MCRTIRRPSATSSHCSASVLTTEDNGLNGKPPLLDAQYCDRTICWQYSPMRQLGACAGNRNSPKLTHGFPQGLTVLMKANYSYGHCTSLDRAFACVR